MEKKKVRDYITINCPNCGALNDVNRGSKVRCEYCETIIEDKENIYNTDNIYYQLFGNSRAMVLSGSLLFCCIKIENN